MHGMSLTQTREALARQVAEVRNLALDARVIADEFDAMAAELQTAYEQAGVHSGLKKKARMEAVAWLRLQAQEFKMIEHLKTNLANEMSAS